MLTNQVYVSHCRLQTINKCFSEESVEEIIASFVSSYVISYTCLNLAPH